METQKNETEKIFITSGGDYDETKSYQRLVLVRHDGASWFSVRDVPAGEAPADGSNYWQLEAKDGRDGADGRDGINGTDGVDGKDGDKIIEGKGISAQKEADRSVKISLSDERYTTEEKEKLQGIDDNANAYTHPAHTPYTLSLYKVAIDKEGHVTSASPATKADLTALGVASTEEATLTAGSGINVAQAEDGSKTVSLKGAPVYISETAPEDTSGVWVVKPTA